MNAGQDESRSAAETFTIDGAYLREQAREAVKLFFTPLAGVYRAMHDRPAPNGRERT